MELITKYWSDSDWRSVDQFLSKTKITKLITELRTEVRRLYSTVWDYVLE